MRLDQSTKKVKILIEKFKECWAESLSVSIKLFYFHQEDIKRKNWPNRDTFHKLKIHKQKDFFFFPLRQNIIF